MAVLKGLKPEKVFAYFEKLCSVPHGSGNTKIISDLCVSFAEELGLKYRQEPCNNVVIWKPASPGCESAEPIILQGHIDMVCAKTDDCIPYLCKWRLARLQCFRGRYPHNPMSDRAIPLSAGNKRRRG